MRSLQCREPEDCQSLSSLYSREPQLHGRQEDNRSRSDGKRNERRRLRIVGLQFRRTSRRVSSAIIGVYVWIEHEYNNDRVRVRSGIWRRVYVRIDRSTSSSRIHRTFRRV